MEERFLGVEIGCAKQQLALCDGEGRILEAVGENVPHPDGARDILAWLDRQESKQGAIKQLIREEIRRSAR